MKKVFLVLMIITLTGMSLAQTEEVDSQEEWENFTEENNQTQVSDGYLSIDDQESRYLNFSKSEGYVEVENNSNMKPGTGDFTIAFWEYPVESGSNDNVRFEQGGVSGSGSIYFYQGRDEKFYRLRVDAKDKSYDVNIDFGQWNHIIIERDDGDLYFYVDGELVDSSGSGEDIDTSGDFYMASEGGGSRYFDGYLDDFRYYNSSISETEVDTLSEERYTELGDETVHWKMNEGSGDTITDSVGGKEGELFDTEWEVLESESGFDEGTWISKIFNPVDEENFINEMEVESEIENLQRVETRVGVDTNGNSSIDETSEWIEVEDGNTTLSEDDINVSDGYNYYIQFRLYEDKGSPRVDRFEIDYDTERSVNVTPFVIILSILGGVYYYFRD